MERAPDIESKTDAVLERLTRLHPKVIDLSLGRMERLLSRLGNPQDTLPPVIHVAGTNGKGSVVATLRAILEAAGLRVHVYTSPHLVRFAERIRVAGTLIEEDNLLDLLEECEVANGEEPITFFEITTAAAFLAFSRTPADVCLLEVGLGGRLDATNVIDAPLVTAITGVSMDHQNYLGDSIKAIATEKAGICKKGVPVIVAPQLSAGDRAIRDVAEEAGTKLIRFGRDWRVETQGDASFTYSDDEESLNLPAPALSGSHQIINAGQAVAILRHQTALAVPESAIRAGLGWVRWPARLQQLLEGPYLKTLPDGAKLWLDGGHNVAAARVLAHEFRHLDPTLEPFFMIVGMLENRDVGEYLQPFSGLARAVIGVPIPGEGCHDAETIADAAQSADMPGFSVETIMEGIAAIARDTDPGRPPHVLIAGSLYLAGAVLRENGPIPD